VGRDGVESGYAVENESFHVVISCDIMFFFCSNQQHPYYQEAKQKPLLLSDSTNMASWVRLPSVIMALMG
jgi:hypothetical protein